MAIKNSLLYENKLRYPSKVLKVIQPYALCVFSFLFNTTEIIDHNILCITTNVSPLNLILQLIRICLLIFYKCIIRSNNIRSIPIMEQVLLCVVFHYIKFCNTEQNCRVFNCLWPSVINSVAITYKVFQQITFRFSLYINCVQENMFLHESCYFQNRLNSCWNLCKNFGNKLLH